MLDYNTMLESTFNLYLSIFYTQSLVSYLLKETRFQAPIVLASIFRILKTAVRVQTSKIDIHC